MNLYTEKEILTQNEQFTFRLGNLYKKDKDLFHQFKDFVHLPIYINDRVTLEYTLLSDMCLNKGKEIEDLQEYGISYLPKISEPNLLNLAIKKIKRFNLQNDISATCSYLQCLLINKKMTHYVTNKCIIDDDLAMNTSLFPDQMGSVSKLFKNILPESSNSLIFWQRFQSLTKQEKVILKLVANGISNKDIGDQLFISKHTVNTHRKNIYKKLHIKTTSEIVKFSLVMDLL